MTDTTQTLSDAALAAIDERVAAGEFPDRTAYLEALIAKDRDERQALTKLYALLDEGLTGQPKPVSIGQVVDDFYDEKARAGG